MRYRSLRGVKKIAISPLLYRPCSLASLSIVSAAGGSMPRATSARAALARVFRPNMRGSLGLSGCAPWRFNHLVHNEVIAGQSDAAGIHVHHAADLRKYAQSPVRPAPYQSRAALVRRRLRLAGQGAG
jgi:hypothetical protein